MKYRMDAEDISIPSKCKKKYVILALIILLIGMMAGVFIGSKWAINVQKRKEMLADFSYGVVESEFTISNIEWKAFPGWRNMSCAISGSFSVNIPKDTNLMVKDIQSHEEIKELSRDHRVMSAGEERIYYDYVEYYVEGNITANNIRRVAERNSIMQATSGYRVSLLLNEEEHFLGYIPFESERFEKWTESQSKYAMRNLEPYLEAYRLSRTYIDTTDLTAMEVADKVKLTKMEEALLNCVIQNERTDDWEYCADLPSLEMWYNGVWIEQCTIYDSALMTSNCKGLQSKEVIISDMITNDYPSLFPGLYRLVIYGTEEDCVISDTFVINEVMICGKE